MKIREAGPRPIFLRTSVIQRVRKMAGPDARDPVIRRCSWCKRFQFVDDDPHKSKWRPKERMTKVVVKIRELCPDLFDKAVHFPVITDGMCPDCFKKESETLFAKDLIPKMK